MLFKSKNYGTMNKLDALEGPPLNLVKCQLIGSLLLVY